MGLFRAIRDTSPLPAGGTDRDRSALIRAVKELAHAEGMVVCLSVKNYPALERKLGLAGTDQFMSALSDKIAGRLPADATCVRLTDSTFGALLPGSDKQAARRLTGSVIAAVTGDEIRIRDHGVRPSFDFGMAQLTPDRAGAELIETAFAAAQRPVALSPVEKSQPVQPVAAKKQGDSPRNEEASIEYRLSLEFQPVVHLHGEHGELYEFFLTVKSPHGDRPSSRNVAATATGMDVALDMWAVDRAIEVLDSRRQRGYGTRLFVKLSGLCIRDIRVPLAINRALRTRSIPKETLIIEVGERSVSTDPRKAQAFFQSLADAGCLMSVSNFGPSTSEFEILEDLPVHFIKLNPALIDQLAGNEYAVAQLAKICGRATAMNMQTIAPNVENSLSLAKLFEAGVEFAQGRQIQEPRPSMNFDFDIVVG